MKDHTAKFCCYVSTWKLTHPRFAVLSQYESSHSSILLYFHNTKVHTPPFCCSVAIRELPQPHFAVLSQYGSSHSPNLLYFHNKQAHTATCMVYSYNKTQTTACTLYRETKAAATARCMLYSASYYRQPIFNAETNALQGLFTTLLCGSVMETLVFI